MYKVSILVPVYGVEQYMERCSRSLFEQTYRDLEFVFVDDCSPDRSVEVMKTVLEDYPERKGFVKILRHDRNKGLAASRNTGLNNSEGDFFICVDSDDWLELDAVELLVNEQMRRDSDLVWGKYLVYENDKPSLLPGKKYGNKHDLVFQMMQRTWDHFLAGRMVRRSLFVLNGLSWKEGLDVAEDRYMMTLVAYYTSEFSSVDRALYHYERRNINALTKTDNSQKELRNQQQELGNVLLLEDFFKDKEAVYQEACSRCVMEELERSLQLAVKYFAKDEFYEAVSVVDTRSDAELQMIGWERNGVKGWINRRFGCKVFSRIVSRAAGFIKKWVRRVLR